MAKSLNKTRLRDTKFLIILTLCAGVFCKTQFPGTTITHESMDFLGELLATVCAIGRIYSTAFIGGVKNEQLITWGPYSLCRNPLYFFSLCGALGIGLMSSSIGALVIIFFGFLIIYSALISREEEYLASKFGHTFENYKARTPRLWPSFKNYHAPAELAFQPKYLTKSVFDAIWWFVPYPIFETAEYLQQVGIIRPWLHIF